MHAHRGVTVGIIGGMGPAATCALFGHIIDRTPARRDQDHLHVIIDSDPATPDRTEALLGGGPSPLDCLVCSARLLESVGASLLAMPCVTAHAFIDQIRQAVAAKVLSMIDQTKRRLAEAHPSVARVGLLATDGTLKADVFAALRPEIELLVPDAADQRDVMSAVYGPAGIKSAGDNPTAAALLAGVATRLVERGAQAIVAGCTEIPLALKPQAVAVPVLDTLDLLAEAVVREALASAGRKAER